MSINIISNENNIEAIYCDMCRNYNCLYKCTNFKQYYGWYCRNCYELIDEDFDDDNNFIITLNMLKTFIEVSNPNFNKNYHHQKLICNEIELLNEIYDPLIIILNRNQYWYDRKYNLCCNYLLNVNNNIFDETNEFQDINVPSYMKIKKLTLKIKYCKIKFE